MTDLFEQMVLHPYPDLEIDSSDEDLAELAYTEQYDEGFYEIFDQNPELAELQEFIEAALEDLPQRTREKYSAEFWGALVSAIPAIVAAAPKIIQGVKGLVGGTQKKKGPRRTVNKGSHRPNKQSTKRPVTTGAPDPLAKLFSLINDPVVLALLGQLVGSKSGSGVQTKPTSSDIPLGAILNAIKQFANEGMSELSDDTEGVSEYMLGNDGEFIIDPASDMERAQLVYDLLLTKI